MTVEKQAVYYIWKLWPDGRERKIAKVPYRDLDEANKVLATLKTTARRGIDYEVREYLK